MTTIGWTRRSSNMRGFRVSNSLHPGEGGGVRQSFEVHSRIPLRASSSQAPNRERATGFQAPNKPQRGKSQGLTETPVHPGTFTPLHSSLGTKITPGCSSNRGLKKVGFTKDNRNLHDKEFLKEAAHTVQMFFQEKCPDVIINGTDIRPMTIKMFIGMVNFLFEALGIMDKSQEPVSFQLSTYEKDLPYWMKKLSYPGLITKAWLQTVNVPNNWHHVIGLLSWLVKIHEISALFNFKEQLNANNGDPSENWYCHYFDGSLTAFRLFNSGLKEERDEFLQGIVREFYELNGVDERKIPVLEAEIEELRQKLEDPNALAEKDALDEAVQKLNNLKAQHEKNLDEMAKIEDEIQLNKVKISEKKKNCELSRSEIESKKKKIEELRVLVSQQPTSVTEIAELRKKSEYLDKEIKYLEKECEDYIQLISRYDYEAAAKRDKILQSTHAFNRSIIQLEQIIPELKEFRIYKDPESEEIIAEMEKMVQSLESLKRKYVNSYEELEMQARKLEKDFEAKTEQLKSVTELIASLEEKNETTKRENIRLQADWEEKEKILKDKVEKWNGKQKAIEEKVKEFNQLQEKQEKLKLRHKTLCQRLQQTEELAEEFWANVILRWKHIPDQLDILVKMVKDQNVELKKGYNQLMTDLKTD